MHGAALTHGPARVADCEIYVAAESQKGIVIGKGGKALKAVAGDFVFVDAPFAATAGFPGDINADERGQSLGWWTFDEATASRPSLSHECAGVERSLELLDATCEREGPFDGVLGFSQGAALAALLCMRRRTLFRFAILVAGTRRPSETLPRPFRAPSATLPRPFRAPSESPSPRHRLCTARSAVGG